MTHFASDRQRMVAILLVGASVWAGFWLTIYWAGEAIKAQNTDLLVVIQNEKRDLRLQLAEEFAAQLQMRDKQRDAVAVDALQAKVRADEAKRLAETVVQKQDAEKDIAANKECTVLLRKCSKPTRK